MEQEKREESPDEGNAAAAAEETSEPNDAQQPETQSDATPAEQSEPKAAQQPATQGDDAPAERSAPKREAAAPAGPATAVIAPRPEPGANVVSRRGLLKIGFWASLGAGLAGLTAAALGLIYPPPSSGFGGKVSAGDVTKYPPGSKTQITEGRLWLVHLTQDQGGPGLLALWWKCPHLGCTVPWKPNFEWPDPATGANRTGWFRCPCHGSTYSDAGVRVFGPAPRSMDSMAITIENGRITIDTGAVTHGTPENADRAVRL